MAFRFNPITGELDLVSSSDSVIQTTNLKANVSPSESPNGTRTQFTLPHVYISGSLTVYLNGLAELNITETSSTTFEFDDAPLSGDDIRASYAEDTS